jgi:hypothetical protein
MNSAEGTAASAPPLHCCGPGLVRPAMPLHARAADRRRQTCRQRPSRWPTGPTQETDPAARHEQQEEFGRRLSTKCLQEMMMQHTITRIGQADRQDSHHSIQRRHWLGCSSACCKEQPPPHPAAAATQHCQPPRAATAAPHLVWHLVSVPVPAPAVVLLISTPAGAAQQQHRSAAAAYMSSMASQSTTAAAQHCRCYSPATELIRCLHPARSTVAGNHSARLQRRRPAPKTYTRAKPVVDDHVSHGRHACRLERLQQRSQLLLAAVRAVEVVQLLRHVALRRHAGTGRRQPHMAEPGSLGSSSSSSVTE